MSEYIANLPVIIWLLLGIIMIILEFTHIPSIGLLFLGFGSITTSIIMSYWPDTNLALVYFGLSSILWFIILWYPLKLLNQKKRPSNYSTGSFDMIGKEVMVITNDLDIGIVGKVKWSGSIFNARLSDDVNTNAKVGELLYVQKVIGNVLICHK